MWKSTDLHKQFSSTLEVLDEMRLIRCVEHTGKAKHITPFVGAQIDFANAFGFKVSIRRSAYCSLALAGLPLQKIEIS